MHLSSEHVSNFRHAFFLEGLFSCQEQCVFVRFLAIMFIFENTIHIYIYIYIYYPSAATAIAAGAVDCCHCCPCCALQPGGGMAWGRGVYIYTAQDKIIYIYMHENISNSKSTQYSLLLTKHRHFHKKGW